MLDFPVDITLRDIPNSRAVEDRIKKKTDKIADFYADQVEFCKVTLGVAQKHKHQGKLFDVVLEVGVPGKVLVVNHKKNEDLYVLLRDSFQALMRQIEEHKERIRGYVKTHSAFLEGKISRLYKNYGFIETPEGEEYYFDSTHLLAGGFDGLEEGSYVSFVEGKVGDSLQANQVAVIDIH